MTLAIAFAPEAFDTKRHAVIGRRVANHDFLAAHIRTTREDELFCYAAGETDLIGFQALAQEATGRPAGRLLPRSDPAHLADIGRLYWPSFAAYGGIYMAISLLWLRAVEGFEPDRFDIVGGALALAGAAVIVLGPRGG